MSETLEATFNLFETTCQNDSNIFTREYLDGTSMYRDTFGSFAVRAHNVYLSSVEDVLAAADWQQEQADSMLRKMRIARVGTIAISIFAEVGALLHLRDVDQAASPADAALTVRNSYDFIGNFFKHKHTRANTLMAEYIDPEAGGTLVDDRLYEERLRKFGIVQDDNGHKVIPKHIPYEPDETYSSRCPAHGYKRPDGEQDYAQREFDILMNLIETHVYPNYLPRAVAALNAQDDVQRLKAIGLFAPNTGFLELY